GARQMRSAAHVSMLGRTASPSTATCVPVARSAVAGASATASASARAEAANGLALRAAVATDPLSVSLMFLPRAEGRPPAHSMSTLAPENLLAHVGDLSRAR